MKKYIATSLTVLLLGVVVIVSSSKGQASDKNKKKKEKQEMTVIIKDSDTIINGKKFSDLSEKEKAEFEKAVAKLHKDKHDMRIEIDRDMKRLNEEMKDLNAEVIILSDDFANELKMKDGERVVRMYKHKAPRAPKAPSFPELGDLPPMAEIPEMPGHPEFKFYNDGEHRVIVHGGDRQEALQSFVYNDGDKRTVIKLMKATDEDKKKIGIKEEEEIKLFPNPAKNELSLNFNFSDAAPVNINIYDMVGKVVKSETIKDYKGGNYEKVYKIDEFKNGTYLVEFSQNKQKVVRKLRIEIAK